MIDISGLNPWPSTERLHTDNLTKVTSAIEELQGGAGGYATISYVIDGGGGVPATGNKGSIVLDWDGEIEAVTTLLDATGSAVVDVKKCTYANYPTAASICASAKPTVSGAAKAQDTTLTGWTKMVTAGDILTFNLDSVATATRITVALKVRRT